MPLDRRSAVRRLLADRGDLLVVTGLGSPSYDAAAAGDTPRNFYLWGAMGGAAMVGLGLALAQPKRPVLVLTGDGEMLMGLGSLATIAVASPGNLALVVLDNEHYAETGMQASHTGAGVDLAGIARAAGWSPALTVRDEPGLAELASLIKAGRPVFAALKIAASEDPRVLPPRDGAYLQHRFRRALGTAPELGD